MGSLLLEEKFLCNLAENLIRPSLNIPGYILHSDALEDLPYRGSSKLSIESKF